MTLWTQSVFRLYSYIILRHDVSLSLSLCLSLSVFVCLSLSHSLCLSQTLSVGVLNSHCLSFSLSPPLCEYLYRYLIHISSSRLSTFHTSIRRSSITYVSISHGRMDGWMDGWTDGRTDDGWMDGWMAGWLAGWVGGWVGGWLEGWIDGLPVIADHCRSLPAAPRCSHVPG